ncbi:MAG: M48 family metalloprotease [Desulfovibrionaceae bacterium]|nr:M48 family metalloprotease [Desulfovibrionaceae bacterium]
MRAWLLVLGLAFLAGACAPRTLRPSIDPALTAKEAARQRVLAVQDEDEKLDRIEEVFGRIIVCNAGLCEKKKGYLGLTLFHPRFVDDKAWVQAYREVYGLNDDYLTVVRIAPKSPADLAGLQEGDLVLSINGQRPDTSSKQGLAEFLESYRAWTGQGPLSFRVLRGIEVAYATEEPRPACDCVALLVSSSQVNALADGQNIYVFQGLLRFCAKDEELALVLCHELAHNGMGHIKAQQGNRLIGAIFDGLVAGLLGVNTGGAFARAGGQMFSQEFEEEADYVGLYYMARAGYDIQNAPDLWRRMASENPESIGRSTTHPSTSRRFVALEATREEIFAKQGQGLALEPETKPDRDRSGAPRPGGAE